MLSHCCCQGTELAQQAVAAGALDPAVLVSYKKPVVVTFTRLNVRFTKSVCCNSISVAMPARGAGAVPISIS